MRQLKIGNTIKIAWGIYRDRFGEYYRLALTNSFWIFVPVYGWAKYAAMMGLLARLAYGEVADNPETTVEAKRHIKSKTWLFFGAGLMSSLMFYLKVLLVLVPSLILISIAIGQNFSLAFNTPFWLVISAFSFYYFYWLMSHLFLYELPLAIGENTNVSQSRDIGWELATDSVFPLQAIILFFSVIFVFSHFILQRINDVANSGVTLESVTNLLNFSPLSFFSFFAETLFFCGVLFIPALSSAIGILLGVVLNPFYDFNSNIILFLFLIIFDVTFSAIFIPFWQSLKAVAYYHLNLSPENTDLESKSS